VDTETTKTKSKHPVRKILLWIIAAILVIVAIGSYYIYNNFNKLLSEALRQNFESSIISDVYELKFEKLGVNLLLGKVQVYNVELKPREKPLVVYPYINSSIHLKTKKILLSNVDIYKLIKSNIFELGSIEIIDPEIEIKIAGEKRKMFPYKDTSAVAARESQGKKHSLESFLLKEFALVNANFHVINSHLERELVVKNLNISLKKLLFDQQPGMDELTNQQVDLSMGEIAWRWQKGAIQYVTVKDYTLKLDSLKLQDNPDTTIFHFSEFGTGLKEFDLQTGDSLFHLTLQSFNLSYRDKSITLKDISFKQYQRCRNAKKVYLSDPVVFGYRRQARPGRIEFRFTDL
jgi:hypothetical protein